MEHKHTYAVRISNSNAKRGNVRVLWFNHRDIMHSRAGGAEREIKELGSRLVQLGFSLFLYTVNDGTLSREQILNGVRIRRASSNINAHIGVAKALRNVNPDIIIDDMSHAVPWFSPLFSKKPVIVYFRHLHARTIDGQLPFPQSAAIKAIERMYPFIYKKSMFVTESESSAADLKRMGIPKSRISIILPGVNHTLFNPKLAKKTKNPSMVYFSGMRDYKRPWLAVEALQIAKKINPSTTLSIFGSGPAFEKTEQALKNSGLSGAKLLGHASLEILAKTVASSWINLNFSTAEGFGYSMLEAAACGTPTIALYSYGVEETINKNKIGILIKDMGGFSKAYKEICNNVKKWSERSFKGASKFKWENTAKDMAALLKQTIEENLKHHDTDK